MRDHFKREINYLRVSVTDFCNFRCRYCMPSQGVRPKKRQDLLTLEEIYHITHLFVQMGITKIRITGGEPLLRPGLQGLVYSLNKLEKIKDLGMTTNGSLLKDKAKAFKDSGLQRVNISLDSLDSQVFHQLTQGELKPVLEGLEEALAQGMKVKINTVLLKGINEAEIEKFVDMTTKYPIDVRFIELMPLGSTKDFSQRHFLSCEEVLKRVPLKEETQQEQSSPAKLYRVENGLGRVGLIRPLSCSFCSKCNRIRLSADGRIRPCLHSDDVIELGDPLRRGENLLPLMRKAILQKPKEHHLDKGPGTHESMNRIGG